VVVSPYGRVELAIRKIEHDGNDGISYSRKAFRNLLADHGKKLGIPSHTRKVCWIPPILPGSGVLRSGQEPRLKANATSSPYPLSWIRSKRQSQRIHVPGIGHVRFPCTGHPIGRIKVAASSNGLLAVSVPAASTRSHRRFRIPAMLRSELILGFITCSRSPLARKYLILMNSPYEHRLSQAQTWWPERLMARLYERLANQRKDRNHKLCAVWWLHTRHRVVQRSPHGHCETFGKSVASCWNAQLRGMLAYKCTASGRQFHRSSSKSSTKTARYVEPLGPAATQLVRRQWTCAACGAAHDRDVNAAINTLYAGSERHDTVARPVPESLALPWGGQRRKLEDARLSRPIIARHLFLSRQRYINAKWGSGCPSSCVADARSGTPGGGTPRGAAH